MEECSHRHMRRRPSGHRPVHLHRHLPLWRPAQEEHPIADTPRPPLPHHHWQPNNRPENDRLRRPLPHQVMPLQEQLLDYERPLEARRRQLGHLSKVVAHHLPGCHQDKSRWAWVCHQEVQHGGRHRAAFLHNLL